MNFSFVQLFKTCLVSLSRIRVLRTAGRWVYRVDEILISFVCRSIPEVRSLYVAGSMASGDIAPGLSDIDIVVVIENLPIENEYRLIEKIEARLRFVMPPWGQDKAGIHVMIYSVQEWALIGDIFLDKRYGGPKVQFEKQKTRPLGCAGREIRSLHHLFKANWRMEDLLTRMTVLSENKLTALLNLRIANRLVNSLTHACSEIMATQQEYADFTILAAEIRQALSGMEAERDDSRMPSIVPRLLHGLDMALGCCFPAVETPGISSQRSQGTAPGRCDNYSGSMELARDLYPALQGAIEDCPIFVSRMGSIDFVICEQWSSCLVQRILDYYANLPRKKLRMATFRVFTDLYLNGVFGPAAFIRLQDMVPFVAAGRLDHQRFILGVYAIFPQVRALKRLENSATSLAFRNALLRLIKFAGSGEQAGPGDDNISINVETAHEGHADGRERQLLFTALRELSLELVNALPGYLENVNPPIPHPPATSHK